MSTKDKKFILGGLVLAVIIGLLAPFLASTNPDGLESTEEKLVPGYEPETVFESPMPDYTIPALGESKLGEVIAIVLGTILIFGLAWGIGKVIKKNELK